MDFVSLPALHFEDPVSKDTLGIYIRTGEADISLCLSLMKNGDLEFTVNAKGLAELLRVLGNPTEGGPMEILDSEDHGKISITKTILNADSIGLSIEVWDGSTVESLRCHIRGEDLQKLARILENVQNSLATPSENP